MSWTENVRQRAFVAFSRLSCLRARLVTATSDIYHAPPKVTPIHSCPFAPRMSRNLIVPAPAVLDGASLSAHLYHLSPS